ncbi:MAG: efflux RND transporter periplasmic adaptor subunit [Planctomycetota bacterium]
MSTTGTEREQAALGRTSPNAEGAARLRAFLGELLEFQCSLVGATGGVVVLRETKVRQGGVIAERAWPGGGPLDPSVRARLERAGADSLRTPARSSVAGQLRDLGGSGIYGEGEARPMVVVGLFAAGMREGSAVLLLPPGTDERDALDKLELTADRFESYLWSQRAIAEAEQKTVLRETLELLDTMQQGRDARAMASLLAHEIARRFGCVRVSVGLVGRDRIRLSAVSGSDDPDPKGEAAEALEAAMEEVAQQDAEVIYPEPPEAEHDPMLRRVTRAAEALSKRFGPTAVMGLPLRVEGDLVGVAILERDPEEPFPSGAASLTRLVAEYAGPALWTRRLADRGLIRVVYDWCMDIASILVGPRYTATKLVCALLLGIAVASALVPIPGRVTAETRVRAGMSRTVVPAITGYLNGVFVEPGDRVEVGDELARIDTSDMELDRAEILGELARLRSERDGAAARRRNAEVRQLEAQIEQQDARLMLLDLRISRATLTAPIDGVVGRGRLDELVGAQVDPSRPLFELVDEERVLVLQVPESVVTKVEVGQTGRFVSKAIPGESVDVRVVSISPVAEPIEGGNVYGVEAEIVGEVPAWLRPGMSGKTKLDKGQTTVMRLLADPLIDRARLYLWW